jgi:hypothetical protein
MTRPVALLCITVIVILTATLFTKAIYQKTQIDPFDQLVHPLMKAPEIDYVEDETRVCKHLADPGDQQTELTRRYRLLNHPTDSNACYLKMDDVLVDNNCTTTNKNLFDPQYASIVTDISPDIFADSYTSRTLDSKHCKISFAARSKAPQDIKKRGDYAAYIDNNDPKVRTLATQSEDVKRSNTQIEGDIASLDAQIESANAQAGQLNRSIETADMTVQVRTKTSNDLQATADQIVAEIASGPDIRDDLTYGRLSVQSGACTDKRTPVTEVGDNFEIDFLDRHNIKCGADEYISKFGLAPSYNPRRASYNYTCCKTNRNFTNSKLEAVAKNTEWSPAYDDWKTYSLSRHTLACGNDGLLNQFQLQAQHDPDRTFYKYTCLQPRFATESASNAQCNKFTTPISRTQGGFNFMDKHLVACPSGKGLSSVHLNHDANNLNMWFDYTCCSTTANQIKQ